MNRQFPLRVMWTTTKILQGTTGAHRGDIPVLCQYCGFLVEVIYKLIPEGPIKNSMPERGRKQMPGLEWGRTGWDWKSASLARSSAKGQSRVRSKDKAELLARTKWISVFFSMQRNLEIFLRVRGKMMIKSMTGNLNIAPLVTAIGTGTAWLRITRCVWSLGLVSPAKPETWGSPDFWQEFQCAGWQRPGREKEGESQKQKRYLDFWGF